MAGRRGPRRGALRVRCQRHRPGGGGRRLVHIFDESDSAFTDTGIVADRAPQTIFTGGGSKDDLDVPGWKHKTGSVPDKDDITNAYAAAYASGGDTFVYFGLDRFAVQGSANVGFWLFQDDVAPLADGTFSGQHEVGDLLVLSEFDQGGGGVSARRTPSSSTSRTISATATGSWPRPTATSTSRSPTPVAR